MFVVLVLQTQSAAGLGYPVGRRPDVFPYFTRSRTLGGRGPPLHMVYCHVAGVLICLAPSRFLFSDQRVQYVRGCCLAATEG